MNIITITQRNLTAQFLAAVTIVSMILSAFPVAFFVADAQAPNVDICHWNGSTFNYQSVNANSLGSAHGSQGVNDGDIIPVVPGFYDGQNLNVVYDGKTGAEWLGLGACPGWSGSISGMKFGDTDGNGKSKEDGELGLSGWTIRLYAVGTPWTLVDSDVTDGDGKYEFSDVPFGEYKVCEVMQDDWTQTFVTAGVNNESPNFSEEGEKCQTVNIDDDGEKNTKNFGNHYEEPVDFCDPLQKPNGMSIAKWHEDNDFDGTDCFDYEVNQQCGSLDVEFTENLTGLGFGFNYVIGTEVPANWQDGMSFPATFAEDENGGSVDVTYYVVGAESDYFVGSDVPNFWDGEGVTVTVNTDCQKPEPERCENLLLNGSFEYGEDEVDIVTNGSKWQKFSTVTGWLIEKVSDDSATTLEIMRGWSGNEAAYGDQYAELDGDHSTKVTQTVATIPGGEYELKWAFAPRHGIAAEQNQLSVQVDGVEVATEGPDTAAAGLLAGDWTRGSYPFTADDSTDITFADAGPSNSFGTFLDDVQLCLVREPEPVANLHTTKIVCTDEADLPNWGTGGPNINENTAIDWIGDEHPSCQIVEGWEFEWAPHDAADPGDTLIGTAGEDWTTFTGSTQVPESAFENGKFWVRELLQEDYIPFTHETEGNKNTNNVSAEIYCHTDVLNYDNYDRVDGVKVDNDYYCVAWNVPVEVEPEVCEMTIVSDDTNFVVEKDDDAVELSFVHDNWVDSLLNSAWIWGDDGPVDPSAEETQTFVKKFGINPAITITNATLKIAADNQFDANLNDSFMLDDNDGNNFSALQTYDVTSDVQSGNNELAVAVTNLEYNTNNPEVNPAGLYYELVITGEGAKDCAVPYEPEPEEPEYGPYCGDGEQNQEWEQCDGGEGCTDYCTLDNQCTDLRLVKITLDENAPESKSFDGTIHLGGAGNEIPNGTWFNFDEVGDDTYVNVANSVDGLAVQRDTVNGKLGLAFVGGNNSKMLDIVAGSIMTMGIEFGSVDRKPNPQFKLEDGSNNSFDDVFSKNSGDTAIEFDLRADTGNDGVTVEVMTGDEYNCPDCMAEVEARVVIRDEDGAEIANGGQGNLLPQVILGDGSTVDFGEWFKVSEAPAPNQSAEWIDDPQTVTNYPNPGDLDGLFVSREGNGQVKVALYGYHNPGGDRNYESLRATIEFNDAKILGGATSKIPGDFKLENHSETDPVVSNDNFDSFKEAGDLRSVDFDFWVDTKADGITITLDSEEIDYCEDDDEPGYEEPNLVEISGTKYELVNDDMVVKSDWPIYLFDSEGVEIDSTTTDTYGNYSFLVEEGESYEVHEGMLSDWEQVNVEATGEGVVMSDSELDYCEFDFTPAQTLDIPLYQLAIDVLVQQVEEANECDFYNEYIETDDGNGEGELDDSNRRSSRSTGTRIDGRGGAFPQVLGASTQCPFLLDYMQIGWQNDPWEVTKLQLFLNIFKDTFGGTANPVTGEFDRVTDSNVKAFQRHYQTEILDPWYLRGIVPHFEATGFVYKTTLWKINDIICPDYAVLPDYTGEDLTKNVDID